MNFLTVVVVLYSTLLATNEIDNVNGMNANTESQSANKSKSSSPWKSGPRSYLAAFETGPRPPESKVEKGAPSKQALLNQKKRERKKMKKANEGSSTPSTPGRSQEEESASTLQAVIKLSSPISSPSTNNSKAEAQQSEKSPIFPEEPAVDASMQDESAIEDYPSLSSRAFKLAKKKYPSDRVDSKPASETKIEEHQESPQKRFTGSPPDRSQNTSFSPKIISRKELRDELALKVMSSRPKNMGSQEVHRLARSQSQESTTTQPWNSEKQQKEETPAEPTTRDSNVLELDKTKLDTEEIQDKSVAPASPSQVRPDDELEKIDQKSTDEPTETQSRELAEEQPARSETKFSPTNSSQKESVSDEPIAHATPPTDTPKSDETVLEWNKAKSENQKRQPYQPKNPSWKTLKGSEEVPPPPSSAPRGKTWRQSHQGAVEGPSRTETWKQKQDMLRRAHAVAHESPPYQFVNKEKYLGKAKSDNSIRGNQSDFHNGKNVWQQKELQKWETNERTQDDSPKQNYVRILSRQTSNSEFEHDENVDKEGPVQRGIDRIIPKSSEGNEDVPCEPKKLEEDSSSLDQNMGESANTAGTSRTIELPGSEASGPPSMVDDEGEKGKKIEESPASPLQVMTPSSPIDIPSPRIEMKEMSKEEAFASLVQPATNEIDSTAPTFSHTQFRLSDDEEKHEDKTSGTLPQSESKDEGVDLPSEKMPSITGTTDTTIEDEVRSTQPRVKTNAVGSEEPGKKNTNLDEMPEESLPASPPSNITPPQLRKSHSLNSREVEGKKRKAVNSAPIISVTPHKSPQSLLSFLKEVGIFDPEEANQQHGAANQMNADSSKISSIGGYEVSPAKMTEIPRHNALALGERKPTNTLLITFMASEALAKLELSTINPMAFGATDVVTLRGSGVIVKFASSDGVHELLKAMWAAEDISKGLKIRSTYVFEHLLCMHHIPDDVQQLQIVFTLRTQYNHEPIRVHFVSYSAGVHRGYKLAIIDVGDSLLNEVEKNPIIQVRWMMRRIDVCLSPHRGKFPPEIERHIPRTPYPIIHEAVIVKVPANISMGELNDSIYKKYGEGPYDTQFNAYFRQNHMKIAQVKISETLLGKIYLSPYVQIRWSERIIITSVDLHRCTKCQRLGHLRYHCKSEERPESLPHENCVDCSSYGVHPQNTVHHETDSVKCPVKLHYVLKCLSELRAAKLRSTMGNIPGPSRGWVNQPAVRPFPEQSRDQISLSSRGVPLSPHSNLSQFPNSTVSISAPPNRRMETNPSQLTNSTISISAPCNRRMETNPSQLPNSTISVSAPSNQRMGTPLGTTSGSSMPLKDIPEHPEAELAVSAEVHEVNEDDEAPPDNISEHPDMEPDMPDVEHILNEQDIKDIIDSLSLPTETIEELISDEIVSPGGPPPHQLKKQIIFEAVRKSVYETLQEVLPSFYETVLEAVDKSVTETLNRLLPPKSNKFTPSASFKTCDSGELSSLPSDDPTENKEIGNKGKEKVGTDTSEERTPSPLDPARWYDEKHIVLVAGKSGQVNVYEELATINIDWNQACIERPIIYPFEKILLICNSTEGAKYLRSVIKKSPVLKVLM